jgi:hypothetical protein
MAYRFCFFCAVRNSDRMAEIADDLIGNMQIFSKAGLVSWPSGTARFQVQATRCDGQRFTHRADLKTVPGYPNRASFSARRRSQRGSCVGGASEHVNST